VSEFEERLVGLDGRLEEAQKLGKALVAAIGRVRAAVKVGRVGDIERGLGAIAQRLDEASAARPSVMLSMAALSWFHRNQA